MGERLLPRETDQELWMKALAGVVEYLGGKEFPQLEGIGAELGGCTQDLEDLKALGRIARKAGKWRE